MGFYRLLTEIQERKVVDFMISMIVAADKNWAIGREGGLLVQEGEYLMFGDAFALTDRDLDRLYEQSTYLASF